MPLSELCDRFTILRLKVERLGGDDNTLSNQFAIFGAEIARALRDFDEDTRNKIRQEIQYLYDCNAQTWDLEFDIRRGAMDDESCYPEVGKRALAIRESNKKRLAHKNEIARLTANLIMYDIKGQHGSE